MQTQKKIFLPLTLDNSTKSIFSAKQLCGICLFVVGIVVYQVFILKLHSIIPSSITIRPLLAVLADIIGVYFIIFLFRKIVLQENKMIRAYQINQNLQKTDISFCWDIFSIRDNRIFYCNGAQAVVIRLTHGYLLDRAPDQETIHRNLVAQALGVIAKQGYKFIYYNREVKDSNLGPLETTEHNLYRYKDSPIFDVANSIIKHTFNVCKTIANTEQEYYIIVAEDMSTIRNLDNAATKFINALHGSVYVKTEVLTEQEIWDFIAMLYGISYIDTAALLSKKFEAQEMNLVTVEKVFMDETVTTNNIPDEQIAPASASTGSGWEFLAEAEEEVATQETTSEEDDFLL